MEEGRKRLTELELTLADERDREIDERERKRRISEEGKRKKEKKRKRIEEKRSVALKSALETFEKEGWSICTTQTLIPPSNLYKSCPNSFYLLRHVIADPLRLIHQLLPLPIWQMITDATESRRQALLGPMMSRSLSPMEVNIRWRKPIILSEIQQYFGAIWLWESCHTSYSYKNFYKTLKNQYNLIEPGRYGILSQCLSSEIHDLCLVWSYHQKLCWNASNIQAADEAIFEWLGIGDNNIAIPGKPHPLGLEVFILSCYSDPTPNGKKKAFIVGVSPHWGIPKPTPLECVCYFLFFSFLY